MNLAAIGWDIRALFSILDPFSRFYVLFLLCTAIAVIAAPFRLIHWIRSLQSNGDQDARVIHVRLASIERNVRELFYLNVIFLCACFCSQLLLGIREEVSLIRNPNMDIIGPFDVVLTIADLGFAALILIHCMRWWVSSQIARVQAANPL
jgi:hypothetical protein